MRIVLDYRPALRERTGVGEYVHGMASALRAQLDPADSLILFSSSLRDRLDADAVPGAAVVDARVPVRVLNYAWHRLEWPPIERFTGDTDIVHAAHPLLIPSRSAVRTITVHDLDFLDHPERTRAEIRRDYPALVPAHARRAELVVVNSRYTAAQVKDRLGVPSDRLVVCRPGAPTVQPRQQPVDLGPIVFIGTIEPRKNLGVLLRAYARVLSAGQRVPQLVLAGGTVEQSGSILTPLRDAPLAGHVTHIGYVREPERRQLLEQASMLVIPSLEEGFGLPALEAMTMGVPVIASRRGALPEVVGEAGTLFNAVDDVELAAAISALLSDPETRRRHAEAGVARAREFSWHEGASQLIDAYRSAVARKRGIKPAKHRMGAKL